MIVIPNLGEIALLNKMLNVALLIDESYILKLYQENIPLSSTSVAADLNGAEANFTGYTAQSLTRAGWGGATIVNGVAQSTYYALQSWTCGANGNTIYGYYILGATSGTLLWAEAFSVYNVLSDGNILNITPVFSLSQC